MSNQTPRTRHARAAAESALVRVVHHYGKRPEFVILGGLVPEFLCAGSLFQHAGTTDIDVQVNLEIALGSINTKRLEGALRKAEFEPDANQVWRWTASEAMHRTTVKFELLADLDHVPAETTIQFDDCENLGATNLRGTGFATRDVEIRQLTAKLGPRSQTVDVYVTGLAGFVLAKCAAARSRRAPKDWYDIAFVLAHNEVGGPARAAEAVVSRFGEELQNLRSAMDDLLANFADPTAQGPAAYARQMSVDHPELDETALRADAVIAIDQFYSAMYPD